MKLRYFALFVIVLVFTPFLYAVNSGASVSSYKVYENISYKTGTDLNNYEIERCKLDIYIPENVNNFPVMVWFHGGSLKMGSKEDESTKAVAKRFAEDGIAVAVVNYRLNPQVKYPAYIDDAAASVAWVKNNISKYGGNSKSLFVGGHSAGGYLAYMLVLAPKYLKIYNTEPNSIAGIIPVAGQTFTHATIREERGIPNPSLTPIIDDAAPAYNAKKDTLPILIVCADGDAQITITQNKYIFALLNALDNKNAAYIEIIEHNHGTLVTKLPEKNDQLALEMIKFINKYK